MTRLPIDCPFHQKQAHLTERDLPRKLRARGPLGHLKSQWECVLEVFIIIIIFPLVFFCLKCIKHVQRE